jgi:hypothetical protein
VLPGHDLPTNLHSFPDLETHHYHSPPPDHATVPAVPSGFDPGLPTTGVNASAANTGYTTSTTTPQALPHRCDECGETFQKPHQLNTHLKKHNPQFRCPFEGCGRLFRYRKDRERHLRGPHRGANAVDGTRYYCPYEGCRFKTRGMPRKDNYQRHLQTQHGEGADRGGP